MLLGSCIFPDFAHSSARPPELLLLHSMSTDLLDNHDASVFRTTRWTRVGLAKLPSEEGRRALAELCEAYYEPVLVFCAANCATRRPHAR